MRVRKGVNLDVNLYNTDLKTLFSGGTLEILTEGEEEIPIKVKLKKENPDVVIHESYQQIIPLREEESKKLGLNRKKTAKEYNIHIFEEYFKERVRNHPNNFLFQGDGNSVERINILYNKKTKDQIKYSKLH